jgi:hypothetical protein
VGTFSYAFAIVNEDLFTSADDFRKPEAVTRALGAP